MAVYNNGQVKDLEFVVNRLQGVQMSGVWDSVKKYIDYGVDVVMNSASKARAWLTNESPEAKRQYVLQASSLAKQVSRDISQKVDYLASLYNAPGKYMAPGESGEHVKALQDIINALGIDSIASDGVYGPKTMEAVKKLQRLVGTKADGYFGYLTAQALKGYMAKNFSGSQWWTRLMNLFVPLYVLKKKNPDVDKNFNDYVKWSMSHNSVPQQNVPQQQPQGGDYISRTSTFGEGWTKWAIIGGILVLIYALMKKK